jgi:hypothetical protein
MENAAWRWRTGRQTAWSSQQGISADRLGYVELADHAH